MGTQRGPGRWLGTRWVRRTAHGLVLAVVLGVAVVAANGLAGAAAGAQGSAVGSEAAPAGEAVPVDLSLGVGESATTGDGALTVTLLQVTEDSRCPVGVVCAWTGRATVVLRVALDGQDRGEVTASLYPGSGHLRSPGKDARVDRFVLGLVDLQPQPDRTRTAPTRVVATIRVEAAADASAPAPPAP